MKLIQATCYETAKHFYFYIEIRVILPYARTYKYLSFVLYEAWKRTEECFCKCGMWFNTATRDRLSFVSVEIDNFFCVQVVTNLVPRAFPLKMGGVGKAFPAPPTFKEKALGTKLRWSHEWSAN